MKKLINVACCLFLTILIFSSCQETTKNQDEIDKPEIPSLKKNFQKNFFVGAALNDGHINGTNVPAVELIEKEFNTITPENIMKWMYIHPKEDVFYFDMADKFVALGEKNDMHIVAHTLLWHSQIAEWMNEVKDSATMAAHLENHINKIVGRYKGRVHTWDVVNEALNEDGSLRESIFLKVMGENYLEHAFKLAAAADPAADLVYNDYNLWKPEKRAGVVRIVKQLQASGAKIDGVGMQAHWSLIGPSI